MGETFSVRNTNVMKGVAIILLLFHHCFLSEGRFEGYAVSFYPFTQGMVILAAKAAKCCVGIFTFLSAYGLTRSYHKQSSRWTDLTERKQAEKFALRRYLNLISGFFAVYVVVFLGSFLWGDRLPFSYYTEDAADLLHAAYYMLLDILGVSDLFNTPSIIGTWWYLGLAITIIVLFPILFKLYQQMGWVLIPALYCLFCALQIEPENNNSWLLLVPVGIFCAEENILERCKVASLVSNRAVNGGLKLILATCPLLLSAYLFAENYGTENYGMLLFSTLLPVCVVIWVYLFLSSLPLIAPCLAFLGKHSMNIYLSHNFLRDRWFQDHIYSFGHFILIVLVLLAESTLLSIGINALKKYSGYNRLTQKIHMLLGA
ncbi:MAG: acyltransferase [Clostridiales bacterium]|nr:acyltransferase [Clostridiales bacterium]